MGLAIPERNARLGRVEIEQNAPFNEKRRRRSAGYFISEETSFTFQLALYLLEGLEAEKRGIFEQWR